MVPGGGSSRGSRGRLAQRDSGVLGSFGRLGRFLRRCAGGQNGQNSTSGEEFTMAKQPTGGDSLAKSRRGRSSGLDCLARGAPWGRGETIAGLSGVGSAVERRLDGDAEELARRSRRAAALGLRWRLQRRG
jgi:hypothetical protein